MLIQTLMRSTPKKHLLSE